MSRKLTGRKKIYTDIKIINKGNVISILEEALKIHNINRSDIEYLKNYHNGDQPILYREKSIRPEINNKIVENHANEIVAFKVGYLISDPIKYVSAEPSKSKEVDKLNRLMETENKHALDRETTEWMYICGLSYRLILPRRDYVPGQRAPFRTYNLDPRDTFVVYHTGLGNDPVMGVTVTTQSSLINPSEKASRYSVYTKDKYLEIQEGKVIKEEAQILGMIPIIEYNANGSRLGAFEIVITMLDAINMVASNRVDGVEQFIQSLIKFINADISAEDFEKLKDLGAIKIKSINGQANADVQILTQELNQMQTQTLVDYMYQTVLTICGMPNRNGGLSTSDTGSAVIMRDGWSDAEARAKGTELMFAKAERECLILALEIARISGALDLTNTDIDVRFTRRNYENIQQKSQVLTTMLGNDKIHPQLAFVHSGMFIDPESAYVKSMEYYNSLSKESEADEPREDKSGLSDDTQDS